MLSRDGAAIAAGAPVVLEQWGGPTPLDGKVRLVEPAAFTGAKLDGATLTVSLPAKSLVVLELQ